MKPSVPRVLGIGLLLGACSPTFAPPIRTGVGSMPDPAQGTSSAWVAGLGANGTSHLRVLHGAASSLDVESTLVMKSDRDHPAQRFFLAGPGLVHRRAPLWGWLHSALSGGFALGCGGARSGEGGCTLAAGGLSVGADLGAELFWGLSLYVANRLQLSFAQDVPATLWGLHLAGLQWDASGPWFVTLEVGPWWYENRVERESAGTANLAFGFRWDTPASQP